MSTHVTRSPVPPLDDLVERLRTIWDSACFTNDGPLVQEFEQILRERLEVPLGFATANGTLALQLAFSGLELSGEVITTPLSFVATSSSLQWMGLTPVFADVDAETWTLDPESCRERITPRTSAILATHIYGLPCDVDGLGAVAREHDLALVFDASHTFGCRYRGRPLASYGDVSTLSFHATKPFHTAEGGFVCATADGVAHRARIQRNFGFDGLDSLQVPGINAKLSELHAALGLCLLPGVERGIEARRARFESYRAALAPAGERARLARIPDDLDYNYAYCPVLLESEEAVRRAWMALLDLDVYARRYFDPPLNRLPWTSAQRTPVAEDLCPRLLCLPIFEELPDREPERIASALLRSLDGGGVAPPSAGTSGA